MRTTASAAVQLLVAGLVVLLGACREDAPPTRDGIGSEPTPPVVAVGLHHWTTADGNTMPYEVSGDVDASLTIVMIHGWMCDRSYWEAQIPVLADRYRTLTLDLPGHGEATADRERWTYSAFGQDVAGLIESLGLQKVVLVGHSAGGPTALLVASRLPGVVRGIVAVDSLQNADFEWSAEQAQAIAEPFEQEFVGTCEGFMRGMFLESEDTDVQERVVRQSCQSDRAAAGAALIRDYLRLDWPALFRGAGVPVRAINSAMFPTDVEANRQYADFDVVLLEEAGHFLQMTSPAEFNRHLLEAISRVVGGGRDGPESVEGVNR